MAIPINDMMGPDGAGVFYDENVRVMLESHMPYYRNHPDVSVVPLDPQLAYKYRGDFQGLLLEMNINACYHWFYMRLNDLDSFDRVDTDLTMLRMVPVNVIDQLLSIYQSMVKKIA